MRTRDAQVHVRGLGGARRCTRSRAQARPRAPGSVRTSSAPQPASAAMACSVASDAPARPAAGRAGSHRPPRLLHTLFKKHP